VKTPLFFRRGETSWKSDVRAMALKILNFLPTPFKIAAYSLCHTVLRPASDAYTINKQNIVLSYAREYAVKCFIETGTCFGNMVHTIKDEVERVYSIEVDDTLFNIARLRFSFSPNVTILNGDSGETLHRLLPTVRERCLFWLDAHYSGGITGKGLTDTPIIQELKAIDAHVVKNHIILIDDVRCFGNGDYPSLETVCKAIRGIDDNYRIEIKDDILRAVTSAENIDAMV
jgi:hypothetical protein